MVISVVTSCFERIRQELRGNNMRDLELQSLRSLRTVALIRLKVISLSGKETVLTVSSKDTVNTVKNKIVGDEFSKELPSYKLVVSKFGRVLRDDKTLEDEGIHEDDDLVLLRRRVTNSTSSIEKENQADNSSTADEATIKRLTSRLPPVKERASAAGAESPLPLDFNTELRKILVSLIDSSILLQSVDEECETADDSERDDEDVQAQIDPAILKQLTDMGFSDARATTALLLNRKSPVLAMEWLLKHEDDSDVSESLPLSKTTRPGKVKRKRREFTPNPRAVSNLKDMGFPEDDIFMALKATRNSQEAACDWLLGERHDSVEDVDQGLDPSNPVYQAIMENPLVQLSLNNPRVLSAFEDMLENPATSAMYISDPETGPVLLQASRIVQGFSR